MQLLLPFLQSELWALAWSGSSLIGAFVFALVAAWGVRSTGLSKWDSFATPSAPNALSALAAGVIASLTVAFGAAILIYAILVNNQPALAWIHPAAWLLGSFLGGGSATVLGVRIAERTFRKAIPQTQARPPRRITVGGKR